jgi:ubiquinone/menaquinone biosynthesis C-methylase UbiE
MKAMKQLTLVLFLICSIPAYSSTVSVFKDDQEVIDYKKNSSLQTNWAISSLASYNFKGNESVLDICCGDGKITVEIAKRVLGGTVIAMDATSSMIEFASLNFPHTLHKNLFFLQGDATHLPFYEQFDLIVSFCCLNWISNQKAVLDSIKQSLVPDGKALLVVSAKHPINLSTVSEALSTSDKWKDYFANKDIPLRYYFTEGEYFEFLLESGFRDIQVKTEFVSDCFENREMFLQWILSISSFAKVLPDEKQLDFAEEIMEAMLTDCPPPAVDGSIELISPKLEIIVQK